MKHLVFENMHLFSLFSSWERTFHDFLNSALLTPFIYALMQISDGAAALILARRSKAHELSLPILGRIVSMADAAQDPKWFTTSPALAFRRALERSGLEQSQIDFVEINEAFAVVDIVNEKLLDLDPSRVNVHGGAIALGHPIGCSGARILGTLINVLRVNEAEIGLATICNGGGGASAIIIARES